jgi:hypothetical protein
MRRVAPVVAAALVAACSAAPNILPTNNFNRPMDIAFACLGAFEDPTAPGMGLDGGVPLRVSGRPMRACHSRMALDPMASVNGRTFAFMPNGGSGDLSVIDANRWKIIDMSSGSAAYGRVPLGALPEQISASDDGCRLATANRGSCDITVVDPSVLLASSFAEFGVSPYPSAQPLQSVKPHWPDGTPLNVAPYEVVFVPTDTASLEGGANLCPAPGAQPATPWRALVTFPSCGLVALVELPSGTIVDSVKVQRSAADQVTLIPAGASPTCVVTDCGLPAGTASGDAGVGAGDDAGAGAGDDAGADGGTSAPPPVLAGPTSIAIVPQGDHAYVSVADVSAILSINLTATSITAPTPESAASIKLEGAVGSNRIRLAVDPYNQWLSVGGTWFAGKFIGQDLNPSRRFLYVIARDGSVRIVDVLNPGSERECETNIDPLGPNAPRPENLACGVVGEVPRRPFGSPGLRFPSIPVDVAFADVRPNDPREETVSGGYAWVITSSSAVYLINIDPAPRVIQAIVRRPPDQTPPIVPVIYRPPLDPAAPYVGELINVQEPPQYPGTPRDRNFVTYNAGLDTASGPARLDLAPVFSPNEPYLEGFWTRGTENNATAVTTDFKQTYVLFPDRAAVTAQTWDVTWEGLIVGQRSSGRIALNGGVFLQESNFCSQGVELGDIVTLTGCLRDTDCPLAAKCARDETIDQVAGGFTVTGLCVSPKVYENRTCVDLAGTLRRYDVVRARQDELKLEPHLDEVVRSNLTPCRRNANPGTGQGGAGGMGGGAGGGMGGAGGSMGGAGGAPAQMFTDCQDPTDPDTQDFVCTLDTTTTTTRCLHPCNDATPCRPGRVCLSPPPEGVQNTRFPDFGPGLGVCADAPVIDRQVCFPQYVTYQVNAARSFIVSGGATGVLSPGGREERPDPYDASTWKCVPNAPTDLRLVSRIRVDVPDLAAAKCTQLPPRFAADPSMFDNPTEPPADMIAEELLAVMTPEGKAPVGANPCYFIGGPSPLDTGNRAGVTHLRARFQNTQIAFMLANFDRAPVTQTTIRFDVHGGARAQTVVSPATAEISMPARIVIGPMDSRNAAMDEPRFEAPYLFVVDQRRLGRGTGGGATRGQLVRINPVGLDSAKGLLPIVEDFQRSAGLFPIQ